jgi:hypothetical protein
MIAVEVALVAGLLFASGLLARARDADAANGTLAVATAAAAGPSASQSASANPSTVAPLPRSDYTARAACPPPAPGYATCLAVRLVPRTAEARAHHHPIGSRRPIARRAAAPATSKSEEEAREAAEGRFGLRPADFHAAYSLPAEASLGQTIAIVDAYNDPTAEEDLATYSAAFGLPPCGKAGGCFAKVNQNGSAATGSLPFPTSDSELTEREGRGGEAAEEAEEARGWNGEISLDIDTAHAICGQCHILLVEAKSPSNEDLNTAEQTAVALGATEISNSWGGPETNRENLSAFNHPGVVITAATGDDGYLNWYWVQREEAVRKELKVAKLTTSERERLERADYPASSPDVVAVGGTSLSLSGGAWAGESVWNDRFGATSGGCSVVFTAPAWQQTVSDWSHVGCGSDRAAGDISADADPYSGAATYDSAAKAGECQYTSAPHWCTVGGTSLASPLIAGVFALAGGAHGVSYPAQTLYERAASEPSLLHDVTEGSNGKCEEPLTGCNETQEANASHCTGLFTCLAGAGYDGPSGLGTPDGLGAFEPGTRERAATPVQAPVESAPVSIAPPVASISGLSLVHNAIVVLARVSARARASVSSVAFSFLSSAPTTVRAVLAKRVVAHHRGRWQTLAYSVTINATAGRNRTHLTARGHLAPGLYLLTLTPANGVARSIKLRVG